MYPQAADTEENHLDEILAKNLELEPDKSTVCSVRTWKFCFGKFPVNPQKWRFNDVNFMKFAKNSGTGAEKLLRLRLIIERD